MLLCSGSSNYKYGKDINELSRFIRDCLNWKEQLIDSSFYGDSNNKAQFYYAIKTRWISQFKNHVGFDKILQKHKYLKSINLDLIKDIVKESINKTKIKYLDKEDIYTKNSIINNINTSEKEFEIVNSFVYNIIKKYIRKKEIDSFEESELERGKNKYIQNIDQNTIRILYEKEKYYYCEIFIIFENNNNLKKSSILEEIKKANIFDWFKQLNYSNKSGTIEKIKYHEISFTIKKDSEEAIKLLSSSFIKEDFEDEASEDNQDEKDKLISFETQPREYGLIGNNKNLENEAEKEYDNNEIERLVRKKLNSEIKSKKSNHKSFPKKLVQKVSKSSYIIATMQSLFLIPEISNYLKNNPNFISDNEGLSFDFDDYMKNLREDDGKDFAPKNFLKKLRKISEKKFSYKEELDPYIFYDFILTQLNNELIGKDQEINIYFQDLIQKYENEKEKNELQKMITNCNSIISKTLYGFYKKTIECDYCHTEDIKYEISNIINIDLNKFYQKEKENGDDLTYFYLEDCIDYYFKEKIELHDSKCETDKNKKCMKIKIIEIPEYLVFSINWGNFKNEEGFDFKENNSLPLTQKFLKIEQTIHIKSDYFENNKQKKSFNYQLFSIVDYFKDKNIFLTKYSLKDEGKESKWYAVWCNSKGKEKGTFVDDFTTPCLLFYKKI